MAELLNVRQISTGYDQLQILWHISLEVACGERVVILGSNGAGKTTFLRTLVGLLPTWSGQIDFDGHDITQWRTDLRIRQGISYMSEVGVIADLSVEDNLSIGGYHSSRNEILNTMETMFEAFPILKERRREAGGSLSGGQRKMLAFARALMSAPKILVMDEPSAGLSPLLVKEVVGLIRGFEGQEMAFLIAEQNIMFLEVATRVYVLDGGKIEFSGTVDDLQHNDAIRKAYFGMNAV